MKSDLDSGTLQIKKNFLSKSDFTKIFMAELKIKIRDVEFPTPVFVASGTFGYGEEAADLVDLKSLGAIITKSIGPQPRLGNPSPRLPSSVAMCT